MKKEDDILATLEELVHYCKTENPSGALMLTGEWGTGKTHLIENELAEELKDTCVIARVSLYGMSSIDAMRRAVKERWLDACSPVLGRLVRDKEEANKNSGFFKALNAVLKGLNPAAGTAADLMISLNVLDVVSIQPVIEDLKAHEKKKVILVFDDLERSSLDPVEMMGALNDYCENQHFNTIVVTNESFLISTMKTNQLRYMMMKGKTVCRTVFHVPDFKTIIHEIIENKTWRTEEYKAFLLNHEENIRKLFGSGNISPGTSNTATAKTHNLLSLTNALEDFYRIFHHLAQAGAENPENWLYSFLAYSLIRKSGYLKDGSLCFECADDEIRKLYPMFSAEYIPDSVREWVAYGIWDKERFQVELAEIMGQKD